MGSTVEIGCIVLNDASLETLMTELRYFAQHFQRVLPL